MDNKENQLLVLRDNARAELEQIKSLEDGLTYLNKIKSIEVWVKAEKKDAELQNMIAEQKLRTQRVLGSLLKEANVSKNSSNQYLVGTEEEPSTLSDMGLTKHQSSAFQQIASIPEETFEDFIQEKKEAVNNAVAELTTTGALKLAKSLKEKKEDFEATYEETLRQTYEKEVSDFIKKINKMPKEYRQQIKESIKS